MRTAEQFFFDELVPEFGEPQSAIQRRSIVSDEHRSCLRYSNDVSIGQRIAGIAEQNRHWIPQALFEDHFVGKLGSWAPDAEARAKAGEYAGKLTLLNVGLSDATFSVAEEFVRFLEILPSLGNERPRLEKLDQKNGAHYKFAQAVDYLAAKFQAWRKHDFIVIQNVFGDYEERQKTHGLPPDQMETAARLSVKADDYILSHELAHHLLAHTDHESVPGWALMQEAGITSSDLPPGHYEEYMADIFGFWLICGGGYDTLEDPVAAIYNMVGVVLTIVTIGMFSDDPTADGFRHPSAMNRFLGMKLLARLYFERGDDNGLLDHYDRVIGDLEDFLPILFQQKMNRDRTN